MFRKEVWVQNRPGDQTRILEKMPLATAGGLTTGPGEFAAPGDWDGGEVRRAGLVVAAIILGSAALTVGAMIVAFCHWLS